MLVRANIRTNMRTNIRNSYILTAFIYCSMTFQHYNMPVRYPHNYPVIAESAEIDFLERRRSALEMVLSQIEDLISQRQALFHQHRDDLEKRISEFQIRFKQLMPGDQTQYPPRAIIEIERHKVMLEKELRDKEVQFMQDIILLQDRLRQIMLDHGNLLALGGKNNVERP